MYQSLSRRIFVKEGYYHIFNRGNARKEIFLESQDYRVFLQLINEYLCPEEVSHNRRWIRKEYKEEIEIVAFCLMPNHFHLLIRQRAERSMSEFMRSLCGAYTKYLNKKYDSVGHTFQDKFKARLLESDADVVNLTKYIHLNPKNICKDVAEYPYSSAQFYTQIITSPNWLNTKLTIDFFSGMFGTPKKKFKKAYKEFLSF